MAKLKSILLLLLLIQPIFSPARALAAEAEVKWTRVNIPTEGPGGNWVLAKGSDVNCLTQTVDGTLYAAANPTGTTYTLFRSRDNGVSWAYTGQVTDAIVAIATASDNPEILYYATASDVYRSLDGGASFVQLPSNPGGAGTGNIAITALAIGRFDASYMVAVATRDSDASQFGSVYLLNGNEPFQWTNTNLGDYDVYAVSFSPNYPADRLLVAVITNEIETYVSFKTSQGWGIGIGTARLSRDNLSPPSPIVADRATIVFPEDFESEVSHGRTELFVGIDTSANLGDVYRITGIAAPNNSLATDLNVASAYGTNNLDVSSLALRGNSTSATLFAGSSQSAQTYLSRDGGRNWSKSLKEPTGQSRTLVLLAPDFATTGRAYAATSGTESAFSSSVDSGVTWHQLALIDTQIGTGGILELAPSPDYAEDSTLFLLTVSTKESLWLSQNGGLSWERVFSSVLSGVDNLMLLKLSPNYSKGQGAIYLSGVSGGNPAIWRSTDNAVSFNRYSPPLAVDVMTPVDDKKLFIGGFDGTNGIIYQSENGGFFFDDGVTCGSQQLNAIALSPDYANDSTILVGNIGGWVYLSSDGGTLFRPLPLSATAAPLTDKVTVAFDPAYGKSHIVYAASDTTDKGIYRFVVGKSAAWERIDTSLPTGSKVKQIATTKTGVLYGTNLKTDSGLERSLNPDYSLGPTFERLGRGLMGGAQLEKLWLSEDQPWALDKANTALMTLVDHLTQPPHLHSPADKSGGVGLLINHEIKLVTLDWASNSSAQSYRWQLSTGTDFSAIPTGFEGEVDASSVQLPSLAPATVYYWRVRATQPVLSPWSEKWSFTTSLGEAVSAPELKLPAPGAREVNLKPIFQWQGVAGAKGYELLIATDPTFTNPVISRTGDYALPATAWEANIKLDYATTYYWRVRGVSGESKSEWSSVSAFVTEGSPAPSPTVSPTPQETPSPSPIIMRAAPEPPAAARMPTSNLPDWLYFLILLLIFSVIVLLIIVIRLWVRLRQGYQRGRLRSRGGRPGD
ncbi:MAG: hypothetical protein V1894_06650 [Chloroflexota bacterium]